MRQLITNLNKKRLHKEMKSVYDVWRHPFSMSGDITRVREKGLEPSRPKTQVPKTCVSAISPLPLNPHKNRYCSSMDRFQD